MDIFQANGKQGNPKCGNDQKVQARAAGYAAREWLREEYQRHRLRVGQKRAVAGILAGKALGKTIRREKSWENGKSWKRFGPRKPRSPILQ